jgi:hypothetical protein
MFFINENYMGFISGFFRGVGEMEELGARASRACIVFIAYKVFEAAFYGEGTEQKIAIATIAFMGLSLTKYALLKIPYGPPGSGNWFEKKILEPLHESEQLGKMASYAHM